MATTITFINDTGTSNGGGGTDHYHTITVNDLRSKVASAIGDNATINSVKLRVTAHIYRSSGNPKVYLKCWFCPDNSSDYNSGTQLLNWSNGGTVAMSSSSQEVDISSYFTKTSPYTINTSYPRFSMYFECAYVWAIDFYCKAELIVDYTDKINQIYIGTSKPKAIYIGTQEAKAVYIGTTKVYG